MLLLYMIGKTILASEIFKTFIPSEYERFLENYCATHNVIIEKISDDSILGERFFVER